MEPPLDARLASSGPSVTEPTADLDRELLALLAEAESCALAVRRGLRSKLAISGLAAVGLIGLGAGATAAGALPTPSWAPWFDSPDSSNTQTTTSGAVCNVVYGVKAVEDPQLPATPAVRTAALAASRDFLRTFDFASIDVAEALKSVPPTAYAADAGPEERETFAVQHVAEQRLHAHLIRKGLPATVAVSAAQTCTDGGS